MTTLFFTLSIQEKQKQLIINQKQSRIGLLNAVIQEYFSSRIDDAKDIAYNSISTKFLEVDKINPELKGVPEFVEVDQRQELKSALRTNPKFESVGLFLPNGDVYLAEPFSSQLNLPQQNYSFRDWHSGAMRNDGIYVSEPYETHYTNKKTIALSIPIQDTEGTVMGIFHTTIQLDFVKDIVKEMILMPETSLYFVDESGKIVISDINSFEYDDAFFSKSISTLDDRGIFQDKLSGEEHVIIYDTIEIGSKKWFLFLIQPLNQAFAPIVDTQYLLEGLLIVTIVIIVIFGVFFFLQNSKIIAIKKQLEESNKKLTLMLEKNYEIDKIKDEFSTMITHELKTPLVPVTVYCKMFKEGMIGNLNKEQTDAINIIDKNIKNLIQLINDIMDARKLDVKKLKFNLEHVDVDELLDEIYSNYKPVINQKGHKLVMNILEKHMKIKTDKDRLRQIFDNLISNSIKVMPKKDGLIEIGLKKEKENIIFYVKDNGFGIPLDKQESIFQKFYQVDTSMTRKIGGTGLGLAISKGLVEGLEGKIWFESDGKTGTTFFIQLPLKLTI